MQFVTQQQFLEQKLRRSFGSVMCNWQRCGNRRVKHWDRLEGDAAARVGKVAVAHAAVATANRNDRDGGRGNSDGGGGSRANLDSANTNKQPKFSSPANSVSGKCGLAASSPVTNGGTDVELG